MNGLGITKYKIVKQRKNENEKFWTWEENFKKERGSAVVLKLKPNLPWKKMQHELNYPPKKSFTARNERPVFRLCYRLLKDFDNDVEVLMYVKTDLRRRDNWIIYRDSPMFNHNHKLRCYSHPRFNEHVGETIRASKWPKGREMRVSRALIDEIAELRKQFDMRAITLDDFFKQRKLILKRQPVIFS